MDVIELTRNLGHAIQQEESFKKLMKAQNACDQDQSLQDLIGDFNLKRMNLSNLSAEEENDTEKISRLNVELRDCYDTIMRNENMAAYNEAKDEFDAMMQRVTAIFAGQRPGRRPRYGGCAGQLVQRELCFLRRLPLTSLKKVQAAKGVCTFSPIRRPCGRMWK